MPDHVTLFEMGPRDGLQNEKKIIPTGDKIKLVNLLSDCGFKKIEVASFVNPKWVPQMADASSVMTGITRKSGITYAALVPNLQGFDAAKEAKTDEIAVFASASEGFSQHNINCSIKESIRRFKPVAAAAKEANIKMRGYVSCVTDCPYDGTTPPDQVARVAQQLLALGCYEISLGDTIGSGTPEKIDAMLSEVTKKVPAHQLAGHYHDTHGRALENILISLQQGLRVFDSAIAGLGGCPFAPGSKGNVATEEVHAMLQNNGYVTGLDDEKLTKAAHFARTLRSADDI